MAFTKKIPVAKAPIQPKAPPAAGEGEMANMLKRVSSEKAPPKQAFPPPKSGRC